MAESSPRAEDADALLNVIIDTIAKSANALHVKSSDLLFLILFINQPPRSRWKIPAC
jgi:hypothetical protein